MYSPINEPPVNLPSYSNYDFFMIIKQILFFCLSILILSCDSNNHIRTYSLPKGKTNNFNLPSIKRETATSGFVWEKPDSWIPSEGSSMRLASFKIPYSVGYGDLSVIQLSGAGGGIESNVNRWRSQLDLDSQSWVEIEKNIVNSEGKLGMYSVLQIINKKIDSAFLCSIISTEHNTIFIKLSLRPIGISEVEDDFITFCSSINFLN
ncbi:uncharacterized protein METZ01_LOCUS309883 [marine metagenome]|uniref:Uncharacterized protein n=1 Tax=marine metagenome TaxID=408172 RepID=A0A382N766_9ZZZZ